MNHIHWTSNSENSLSFGISLQLIQINYNFMTSHIDRHWFHWISVENHKAKWAPVIIQMVFSQKLKSIVFILHITLKRNDTKFTWITTFDKLITSKTSSRNLRSYVISLIRISLLIAFPMNRFVQCFLSLTPSATRILTILVLFCVRLD